MVKFEKMKRQVRSYLMILERRGARTGSYHHFGLCQNGRKRPEMKQHSWYKCRAQTDKVNLKIAP